MMMDSVFIAFVIAFVGCASGTSPLPPGALQTPNAIHDATSYATLVTNSSKGMLYDVATPDGVKMKVIYLWGSAEEMGVAQAELLQDFAFEFIDKALPEFLQQEVDQINTTKLPEWLKKIVEGKVGIEMADALLEAIYYKELKFMKESKSNPVAEMTGLAQGLCNNRPNCDVAKLTTKIQQANMIPELLRMTCSMFGAYGPATETGKLLQLRSLDFGDGPMANYTTLFVRFPDTGNPYVSVGFPGLVGAITGWSTKVGISEKVWETYTGSGIQPGAYDGLPDTFVLRDILQFAENRFDAVDFVKSISRTWAMFIGVGDFETQEFNAIGYRRQNFTVYGPHNITEVTHMPVMEGLVYIDKHPQPSHDNQTMPGLMTQYYGHFNGTVTAQYVPRMMQSGDLHIGIYDYGVKKAWIATGKVTADGKYGPDGISGKACNQPYLEFDMETMFNKGL